MRYGLMKRLRRGDYVLIYPTFRCNLSCSYCSLKYINGKYPESKEITLTEWKRIISSFPRKLREVKISGGEPMLLPYFADLVNWLTDNKYFVYILSNLTIKRTDLKPSKKILIKTTYHSGASKDKWLRNLEYYQKNFRVIHQVIDKKHLDIKGTKLSEMCYSEYGETCGGFLYAPDGRLFTIANELYKEYV